MNFGYLSHKATAYFQAGLSLLFVFGYFIVLEDFLTGRVKAPAEYKDMILVLIGVLTASVGTIITFWFNRQRTSEEDKPSAGPAR